MIDLGTAELPRSLTVGGAAYAINTDYRIMIDFERQISAADTSDRKAFAAIIAKAVSDLFLGRVSLSDESIDALLQYYRCGRGIDDKPGGDDRRGRRYYDFDEDSELIYAAFRQQYGVDLTSATLHWWEFRSMFIGLTDGTELVRIMQYRCADLSKIKNKEERARIKALQKKYALKERRIQHFASLESRDEAFRRKVQERFAEVKAKTAEKGVSDNG